jgi:hypothetical protein
VHQRLVMDNKEEQSPAERPVAARPARAPAVG